MGGLCAVAWRSVCVCVWVYVGESLNVFMLMTLIGQLSTPYLDLANLQSVNCKTSEWDRGGQKNMHAHTEGGGEHFKEAKQCGYEWVNEVMKIKRNKPHTLIERYETETEEKV